MILARCRFCDFSPRIISDVEDAGHKDYYTNTYVLCTSCLTRGPIFSDFDYPSGPDRVRLASEGWNKIHDRKDASR